MPVNRPARSAEATDGSIRKVLRTTRLSAVPAMAPAAPRFERPDVGLICKACGHWPVEATAEPSAVTTDERLSVVYDEQAESRRLRASLSGLPVAPKEEGEADA